MGEIFYLEGKPKAAQTAFEEVLVYSKKMQLRYEYALALMGICQILIEKKSFTQVVGILSQIKKFVRVLGTRKLKAKFMMISGLAFFRKHGVLP